MKIFANESISKKIMIAIILIMTFNFILPTISKADEFGGKLFQPIAEFLKTIADLVIGELQKIFVGFREIKVLNSRRIAR